MPKYLIDPVRNVKSVSVDLNSFNEHLLAMKINEVLDFYGFPYRRQFLRPVTRVENATKRMFEVGRMGDVGGVIIRRIK